MAFFFPFYIEFLVGLWYAINRSWEYASTQACGSVDMEKILIIDDSNLQITYLRDILSEEYEITTATTAKEGLACIKEDNFSLILLDAVMPDIDGFTMLKILQEELITQHIPVIMITALSDIKHEERGFMLGAVDYITKPFHPSIVKARVRTHIKLYQYRIQIERQSMSDQLTGVANRRRYDEYSGKKWAEAIRFKHMFSVCMMDIDKFKVYNDVFGHPAGDVAITSVAKTVSSYLQRSTDFFARYGGEEFVAILVGCDAACARDYMEKVRKAVEDLHIPHSPEISPWVTVSIGGVTVTPKQGDDYDKYLKIADTMLYDAKRLGRNRVEWADETAGEKGE